jgi:glycosyltransferase involved in cell wall biosynthesis
MPKPKEIQVKIALVSYLFEVEYGGGAALVVRTLAEGLIDRGFEVVVITTHAKRQLSVERAGNLIIYRFFPKNLYWVGEKDRQPSWKKVFWQLIDIWNPFVLQKVRRILAHEQPDIVHVHKLRGLSPAVWAAAKSAGVGPIIQTCHDYELMSPEGTLSGQVGRWANQNAWGIRLYQTLRAKFAASLTAATTPSRYLLDTLTGRGFFTSIPKYVVPNSHGLTGQQLAELRTGIETKQNAPKTVTNLLYLGRLEATKGIELLCEAFSLSAGHYPTLRLNIAGWGTLADSLQQKYGTHPQITFHGPVFNQKKSDLLAASDALIVPSQWPEVFGIVIAEAYAHGVPVIASNIGGIPELVEHQKTGFLVPPGDIEALSHTLNNIAQNPDLLHRMIPACLEAGRRYTVEAVNNEYLTVYKTVCGANIEPA